MLDAAEDGTQPEQIERAIGQAVRRGWIDSERLRGRAEERSKRVTKLIGDGLAAAEAAGRS